MYTMISAKPLKILSRKLRKSTPEIRSAKPVKKPDINIEASIIKLIIFPNLLFAVKAKNKIMIAEIAIMMLAKALMISPPSFF